MKKVYVSVILLSIICMALATIGVIMVTPSEPTGAGDDSSAGVNETEAATATTVNTVLYTNTMNAPHLI